MCFTYGQGGDTLTAHCVGKNVVKQALSHIFLRKYNMGQTLWSQFDSSYQKLDPAILFPGIYLIDLFTHMSELRMIAIVAYL